MSLILSEVSFAYGAGTTLSQRAVERVSMSVAPGELTLVMGPTGSGKSTLLRLASGLLQPTSGMAELDGVTLSARVARGRVGLVFQNPEVQLFADTVLDDVAFGPVNLGASPGEARARAAEALSAVRLDAGEFGERSPFSLSGGESRRVAIAGVLAMRPDYVLFDEPTAGLDAKGRESVRSVLASLRASAGVVVVTHDADEFLADADNVLILCDGAESFRGPASELIARPEGFERAGLRPPEVMRAQMLARERGARLESLALDPAEVARSLAGPEVWPR